MHLAAVIIGVGPLYAMVFYSGLQSLAGGEFKVTAPILVFNLVVMLSFAALLIALLLILGERPADLQWKAGTIGSDIAVGIGLLFQILGALVVFRLVSSALEKLHLIPALDAIPDSNIDMIGSVVQDPLMFALFLGPVIWIQAAVIEELTRTFVLSRLWKVWTSAQARILCVLIWSALFGLAHIYQGATGVIGTALIGLVLGLAYLRHGRVLPLILAHGLYDTLATLALLYAYEHPELFTATL
jgi:membrane protease YdiL (CAAX protease family)